MEKQFSAGIVVYKDQPEGRSYLLLKYTSGHWDYAKGKMEKDEGKHAAALRELQEEAGITADILPGFEYTFDYWFRSYEHKGLINKTVYFFVGIAHSTDIVLSDEHTDYAWLSYGDALKRLTYKNAYDLLVEAEAFLEGRA